MKKILSALLAVLILVSSVEAAIVKPLPAIETAATTTVAAAPAATATVKPKPSKKKMNFVQKLATKLMKTTADAGGKSQLTALLLALFLGGIGIHRFYLGYTWQGIVQILTLGGLGIWALIDLIRIITGDLKPKNGEYEKTL